MMLLRFLPILFLSGLFASHANGQVCANLGQTPSTAFPVCGIDTFSQANVPICATRNLPVPCTDGASYQDKNPYWYQFTCYTAGTLAFRITPNNLADDYDWQIFDITRRNPDDVFSDGSLFVTCNWSGEGGVTGTGPTGNNTVVCAGLGMPLFSKMPTLAVGHQYLLLVSHFTDSQSGYTLSFTGGTASITDPLLPLLQSAKANCDAQTIRVRLNKKMKCSSIAANGSDFALSPSPSAITNAIGIGCTTSFDTDTVQFTIAAPLPVGSYFVIAQNGNDANTLLDNCDRNIPVGDRVPLAILPVTFTPMDSIVPVACAPDTLQLIFKKPMLCNSIAADGSDFRITGPTGISVATAFGNCNSSGTSTIINVVLSTPIVKGGLYKIILQKGTDGNTIFDECSQETPAGSQLFFTTKDTVDARFGFTILFGCKADTVRYFHNANNGVNSWQWVFDGGQISNLQNPQIVYTSFGNKVARLAVSNGTCTDTATANINLDNTLKAAFGGPAVVCPKDTAVFADSSLGKIMSWQWNFGNGNTSNVQNPPAQFYPPATLTQPYPVRLVVTDGFGCADSLVKNILVVNNCFIDVPTAFTPNGDGLNDFLYPLNAYKAVNLEFKVFNRLGQLVWQTKDWTRKWDGRFNGEPQAAAAYVWQLAYTHVETGKKIFLQGTSVLIR